MHGSHNVIVEAPSKECYRAYFVFCTGRHSSGSSPKAGCLCSYIDNYKLPMNKVIYFDHLLCYIRMLSILISDSIVATVRLKSLQVTGRQHNGLQRYHLLEI